MKSKLLNAKIQCYPISRAIWSLCCWQGRILGRRRALGMGHGHPHFGQKTMQIHYKNAFLTTSDFRVHGPGCGLSNINFAKINHNYEYFKTIFNQFLDEFNQKWSTQSALFAKKPKVDQRLWASPPDHHWPPAAWSSATRPTQPNRKHNTSLEISQAPSSMHPFKILANAAVCWWKRWLINL